MGRVIIGMDPRSPPTMCSAPSPTRPDAPSSSHSAEPVSEPSARSPRRWASRLPWFLSPSRGAPRRRARRGTPGRRHRFYRLDPAPLQDLYDWAGLFTAFWTERIANLHRHLERKHET
jgi:hypothetical protein